MRCRIIASVVALACLSGDALSNAQNSAVEFIGSTPCDARTKEFLGGVATDAPCHYVMWRLTLSTNSGAPATYSLVARYGIPVPSNPNQSVDGPEVTSRGTVELLTSTYTWPGAAVYQLKSEN